MRKKLGFWVLIIGREHERYTLPKSHDVIKMVLNDTLPSFGKHHGYGVTKDLPLVGYILHDITGPPHQISNLVARRWPINIPFKIFFHLFSEEILYKNVKKIQMEICFRKIPVSY